MCIISNSMWISLKDWEHHLDLARRWQRVTFLLNLAFQYLSVLSSQWATTLRMTAGLVKCTECVCLQLFDQDYIDMESLFIEDVKR